MKRRRMVFIRWRDAADHDPGNWTELPPKPGALITTVGFVIVTTKTYVTICQSFDDNEEPLYRGVHAIPRSTIVEMHELRRKP